MALLGNQSVLTKLPVRALAGSTVSVTPQLRSNWLQSGRNRNRLYVDMATTARHTYAVPTGYYPPVSWIISETVGEMSTGPYTNGSGSIVGNLAGGLNAVSTLTGSGYLSPAPTLQALAALLTSLTGSGGITNANASAAADAYASLTGNGMLLSAQLTALAQAVAILDGSGTISGATLHAIAEILSNLVGSGEITNADLAGILLLLAAISGSGSLTNANANAAAVLAADLTASGMITYAAFTMLADMSANIRSYGSMTPEGIRDAVWDAPLADYPTHPVLPGRLWLCWEQVCQ